MYILVLQGFAVLCAAAFLCGAIESTCNYRKYELPAVVAFMSIWTGAAAIVVVMFVWIFWCAAYIFPMVEPHVYVWPLVAVAIESFGGLAVVGILLGFYWLGKHLTSVVVSVLGRVVSTL